MDTQKKSKKFLIISLVMVAAIFITGAVLTVVNGGGKYQFLNNAYSNVQDLEEIQRLKALSDTCGFWQNTAREYLPILAIVYLLLAVALCRDDKFVVLKGGLVLLVGWVVGGGLAFLCTYEIFHYLDPDVYLYLEFGFNRTVVAWAAVTLVYYVVYFISKKKKTATA
jgi:glucose-6-phosphate-specific signal transduction histidine kinase